MNTCWFCQMREASRQRGSAFTVSMHGNIVQEGGRIEWQQRHITIPRCLTCKGAHDRERNFQAIGATIGIIVGLPVGIVLVYLFLTYAKLVIVPLSFRGFVAYLLQSIVISLLVAFIFQFVASLSRPKYAQPESSARNHPFVSKLKAEGWKIGEKPQDAE